jgi:hypothetical protein
MDIFSSFNSQVDDLLQNICKKIQLTKTQYKLAEERYRAVADWLSKESSSIRNVKIDIYPQGSLRIGTTVKPINQEEFDLDLVCQMHIDYTQYKPEFILSTVSNRLEENEAYKKIMTVESRCIRLNYSNDFHLDIVPACPADLNNLNNTGVFIPDIDKAKWRYTDPKGYAEWFDKQKALYIELVEARNIEQLPPDWDNERKAPLQYCIQLMKRYRDIAFENEDEKIKPKSIVISTLAAMSYKHETSITDSLTAIFAYIVDMIEVANPRLIVKNPINSKEDITEAWDKNRIAYNAFCEWIQNFKIKWQKVNQSDNLYIIAPILQSLFGELTNTVLKEQAERVSEARKSNMLGVSNGLSTLRFGDFTASTKSTVSTTAITYNTFFGN